MQVNKYLERFNQEMKANPRLLQDIVDKYFLVIRCLTIDFHSHRIGLLCFGTLEK